MSRAFAHAPIVMAAALLVTLEVPAFAAHPVPAPVTYRVRPGTVVAACGSIAFHCETWQLRGTIGVFHQHHDHDGVLGPSIVDADLELVTASGHVMPFPHQGDLPLTELSGSADHERLLFESPAGSRQTVEISMAPISNAPLSADGLVLDGFYDEGCCDRFRIDLGNVVLRPDRGGAALDLHGARFHVVARWRASGGRAGEGRPVALDRASGYFWFFQPENPEVFVKVIDACAVNGRYWLFAGGLTNLEVELGFFDDRSDFAIPSINPLGQKFATFVDTVGFPCNPAAPGG
jgi:hypothetical protein